MISDHKGCKGNYNGSVLENNDLLHQDVEESVLE